MVATQYKGKDQLIAPNIRALELGRQFAFDYLQAPLPLQVRASDQVGRSHHGRWQLWQQALGRYMGGLQYARGIR